MDVLLDRQSNEQPTCHYPQYVHDDDTFKDEEEMKLDPEVYLKNKTKRRYKALEHELKEKIYDLISTEDHCPKDDYTEYIEGTESANEEEDD